MELNLTLKNHCIETGIKKQSEQLIKKYFKKNITDDKKSIIEVQIDALKFILEHADFQKLRHNYPELCDNDETPVKIIIPDNYFKIIIMCYNQKISPPWK
ncbi:MAG: hypothetical protein K9L30_11110 [Desulfobacterales bacterium]|nr:hypothetical protein [Desulfobacterales bacterium]